MSTSRRRGFTMVELMIVIVIIGLLMALLLSAVQSARESARRSQCLHKMKEVGSALLQFEDKQNHFPGWRHYPFPAWRLTSLTKHYSQEPTVKYATAWFPQLFPYMGRNELFDPSIPRSWKRPHVVGQSSYSWTPRMHQKIVCPSDTRKMASLDPLISFVVNAGRRDNQNVNTLKQFPPDWRANGVFHDLLNWRTNPNNKTVVVPRMDTSYIRGGDGLSTTGLISESLSASFYFHINETNMAFIFDPPTASGGWPPGRRFSAPYQFAVPSSNHPGGVNALFADGHARFVNTDLDYLVYCALLTPNGSAAKEPGSLAASDSRIRNQPKLKPEDY